MGSLYRVYGQLNWASMSGNALLTMSNILGSDKLLTVRGFEVRARARKQVTQQMVNVQIMRVTGLTGNPLPHVTKNDTDAADLTTSQVIVYEGGSYAAGDVLLTNLVLKELSMSVALTNFTRQMNVGRYNLQPATLHSYTPAASIEPIVVNAGESIALVPTSIDVGIPLRIEAEFLIVSTGHCYRTTHIFTPNADSEAIWGLANIGGSGLTVKIVSLKVSELGDSTTPYFQLVRVNPNAERLADDDARPNVFKYDTNAADLTGIAQFAMDVPCLPDGGIPQQYLSDASAGSPKGLNYLHTKDFLGPSMMVCFPEYNVGAPGLAPDSKGLCNTRAGNRIVDYQRPIVVRPSETIGLVTSAELATGANAMSLSGLHPFDFAIDIEVTDLVTPTIQLTGLQTGTRVAIVEAGTETLVVIGNEVAGTFTYTFEASPGDFVDIRILAPGFVFQQIDNVELLASVQTFLIDQVVDLIYDSMLSEAVTFDGATKRIVVDTGNTSISVPAVYTEWVDWAMLSNNLAFFHAFENQGGAVIDAGAGTEIPAYCYLVNGWRIRPQEASGTLEVNEGIILVDGGGDPFVDTLGSFVVRILYQQPVQAITVSTSGTVAPTQQEIRDAMALATAATPAVGSIDARLPAALVSAKMDSHVSSVAAALSRFQAKVWLDTSITGPTNRYIVAFYKDSQPATTGVTVPFIRVVKTSDGSDLVASVALTVVPGNTFYKHEETVNLIVPGDGYVVIASATIDGVAMIWEQPVSRDS